MFPLEAIAPEKPRPIRRAEYDRMVEMGFFENERLELIEGVIVRMSPQSAAHAHVIRKLNMLLASALAGRAEVSPQCPLAVSDVSEPEPDLAVVDIGDYLSSHPSTALLVVEVAETSLTKDLDLKAGLYASADVIEYWVVNLRDRHVIVHSQPREGTYRSIRTVDAGQTIVLTSVEGVALALDDFLPPARTE